MQDSRTSAVLASVAGAAADTLLLGDERRSIALDGELARREAEHARKVERIATQLRTRRSTAPLSMKKKAVSHQVPKAGDLRRYDEKIDLTDLDQILEIDPVRRICVAEPGVTFADLLEATMKHGLAPIIVPELKTITIGGAVSGCSIESMSFVHGGFHDTCLEYEVITASGEVLVCTPENENSLVFQMVHGSFGTLGILSKLKFRLIPAKKFVKMRYEKYATLEKYLAAIWRVYQNRAHDFMDGIIHSPTEYVLSLGDFVDEAPYTNRYDWLKVYYASTARRQQDFLKTPDYYFRYDRGVTNVHPKSFLGRLFFGKFLGSSEVLRLADKFNWLLPKEKPTIILDVFLPFSRVPAFLDWYGREFKHFPLWCVPYKRVRNYEWINSSLFEGMTDPKDELFVDLAIYGMKQRGELNYHKLMEEKLLELGGIKTLISHNYYSEEDFWKTWNRPNYEAVKARVDPNNIFRDLYSKMCRVAMGVGA